MINKKKLEKAAIQLQQRREKKEKRMKEMEQ
jgi:hypothetical protein